MMIFNLIAQTVTDDAQLFGTGLIPENPAQTGLVSFQLATPLTSLELFISRIIGLLTTIGSIIFIVMFLYGTLKWITAGGDSSKVGKARDSMVQGVIGLIIMVGAYGIIGLIGTAIGIRILNPATQIRQIFGIQESTTNNSTKDNVETILETVNGLGE